jgi:hypothetical protein
VDAFADVSHNGTPIIAVALRCFAADGGQSGKSRVQHGCIVHI